MKTLLKVIALIGLFAGLTADAHVVSGTLKYGRRPVRDGVVIDASCAGRPAGRTVTGRDGSYRLRVAGQGDCRLIVHYQGAAPSLSLPALDQPASHNLVLHDEGRGYSLRSE